MFSRNIPLYKLDLSAKNPDNLVKQEYYSRTDTKHERAFVLRHGPFYTESLMLYKPNGELLVEETHYEIFGIASELTAFTNKEVAMVVVITDESITEWFVSYQVVGHFSVLNRDLLNMVAGALEDERPVYYKNITNKPLWFNPILHQHDIRYEIHSFQDIIELIGRLKELKDFIPNRDKVSIEHFNSVILSHINEYERMLLEYTNKHDADDTPPFTNSHGVTAKQMEMEKVDNYKTATLIDVLNGYRSDLHVTVDYVKQALDATYKESSTLVKKGSIPVLRFGSNSFIPTPIKGSFEGMGGTDFFVGLNIEANGHALIMTNRNDGRVNGLYFMQNKDAQYNPDKWTFTSHTYTHPTADADGVKLRHVLNGSDGRFLIVGGQDSNGNTVWYYTLGHGTFDPLKHKLVRIPAGVDVKRYSSLCTESYPNKVILFTRYSAAELLNSSYKNIAFDLPADQTEFDGVNFTSDFLGFAAWEYSLADDTWRRITFTYTQVGLGSVTSPMWIPWKWVVKAVTADYPRKDGSSHQYGLAAASYQFTCPINLWEMRSWFENVLGLYDKNTDKLYIKYCYRSIGFDERSAEFKGGVESFGMVLKDRTVVEGVLNYTIENRKGLKARYTLDTQVTGATTANNITDGPESPLGEWWSAPYDGQRTQSWLGTKRFFAIGSTSWGTYPVSLSLFDFRGLNNTENLDNWIDGRFDENLNGAEIPGGSIVYNETNPAGLTIGAHSTFWLQLDVNNAGSMGAVSFSDLITKGNAGLLFRKQPALDSNGTPFAPTKTFALYEALDGKGPPTYGYALDNTTYPIYNAADRCFVTNIFVSATDNRKAQYAKHLIAHSPVPAGTWWAANDDALTDVTTEWQVVVQGEGYTIKPTKTYDLKDAITTVLIPHLEQNAKTVLGDQAPVNLSFANALITHRIAFTNIRSSKYEELLIFGCLAFDDDPDTTNHANTYLLSVAFSLSGGTLTDGLVKGATVTPVGNIHGIRWAEANAADMRSYATAGHKFYCNPSATAVQPRDLVHQFTNGLTHVNMQWGVFVNTAGNSLKPGMSYLVSENGITGGVFKMTYYTTGEYFFFHHPYYGLVDRTYQQRSAGSSEVGKPYPKDIDNVNALAINGSEPWVMANSNYLESAFSLYITTDEKVLLNGIDYTLKSTIIDLRMTVTDPRNKTLYLYLDYDTNGPTYRVSLSPLPETASRGLISIIKTNNDSIFEITNYNVFTMNGIRISTVRHGAAIPAATGSIDEDGQVSGWVS